MATTAEYGLGEFAFPRGWFMVARVSDVANEPTPLRMLGRDMVIYKGESGRIAVMDAYCPHMRAHLAAPQSSGLARQRIEGDSIRCPYHWWRFGPDGKCDNIPYLDAAPPEAAKVRAYPVEQRFGCVFIWHDAEGGEPEYAMPDLAEWHDPSWVLCDFDDLGVIGVHPQEIVDNMVDARHFGPIHGQKLAYFENVFDAHVSRQLSGGGHETMTTDDGVLDVDAWYTGPGILLARYVSDTEAIQLIIHTPKEDGQTQLWHGLITRGKNTPANDEDRAVNQAYHDVGLAAFSQDFAIWRTKDAATQILRVPTDGPFQRLRTWYKQFYNPRAKAKEFQSQVNGSHGTRNIPRSMAEKHAAE